MGASPTQLIRFLRNDVLQRTYVRVEGDQSSPSPSYTMMVSKPWPYVARSFGKQIVDLLSKGSRSIRSTRPEVSSQRASVGVNPLSAKRKGTAVYQKARSDPPRRWWWWQSTIKCTRGSP